MKKTRLLFVLLMAVVMMAVSPQKVWAWGGSGTSSSPYTISSATDLQKFANIVNGANGETRNVAACAKLTADITLSGTWTAMGTSSYAYTGTFDGQGHKISGLNLTATAANAGLFGYVNGATIKNFTLAGSISSNSDNVGSVVGSADGETKIYNVYSSVNVTMTAAKSHIGGIIGQILQENNKYPELKGCAYSGIMNLGNCSNSNGGIVGYCEINANVKIEYCFFSGSISTSVANPNALGGILGYADDDGSAQNFLSLSNCFVSGTISPSSGTYVGAIAGQPKGKVANSGIIANNNYISGVAANALGNSKTSATSTPITISVTAGANGSVSQSYVNPTSTTATQLQVVATPNSHYHFSSWSDSKAQTHNVGLTSNVSLTASFAIDQHTITVATNSSTMGTVSGGGTFDYNTKQTITATPKTHYHFVKWDDGDTNASRTITVTGDKTYTATFAIDQHTITVKPNDNNMGSVSGGGTFDYNSKQTITATPKTHYHFVKWDDGDTNASRQITVTGDKTYTATFAIDQHTITVKANNSNYGSVSGGGTFDYNTKQTITATAKNGYHFVKWSDGDTNASRQITVTANATYTATFEAHSFGEWITDTPATCTVAGSKHRDCSRCDGKDIAEIPAIGHGTEGYNFYYGDGYWNDGWDGTYDAPTIYAKLYCKKCKKYAFDDYITPTKVTERHIDATCAANGNETWQAILVYNNDGDVPYTSEPTTKDYAIPAKGHVATQDFDENGFAPCSACGGEAHQPANCIDLDDYSPKYDIANAGQLYWFAELVNTGKQRAVGYLTADIVVNDGTFDADGNFTARGASTPSTPRSWTPIGNGDFDHKGWFDGQGHTISGLYFNDPNTTRVGFMGRHAGSGIENLGIISCYFKGKNSVGGIVGYNSGPIRDCYATDCYINGNALTGGICGYISRTTLRNCWSDCDVMGREDTAGGICGMVFEANLTDCYSMGTVTGNSYAGGIVGRNVVLNNGRKSFVYNCYTIATVNGEGLSVGSICGANVFKNGREAQTVVKNCYSNNTSSLQAIGKNEDEDYTDGTTVYLCETGVSADRFASGEIAYKLNGSVDDAGNWTPGATDGTQAWYQQLGTDSYPSLEKDGDDNTVYTYTDCQSQTVYTNDANCTDGHQWGDDRICTICHQAPAADHTGTSGSCTWTIYEDGLMVIEPKEGESGTLGDWEYYYGVPWYPHRDLITSVEIRGEVIATTCLGMFAECSNLRSISWGGFNTAEVVNMEWMFDNCTSLQQLNLNHFNTGNVSYMSGMFYACTSLQQLNLNHFNTGNVTSMGSMFYACSSLQQLDLSSFNTAKVQFMYSMFGNCLKLATLKLSDNFVLDEEIGKDGMFTQCGADANDGSGGWIYYVSDYYLREALRTDTDFDHMQFSNEYRYFNSLQILILHDYWVGDEYALFHYDLNYDGKITVSDLTRWIWIENINK